MYMADIKYEIIETLAVLSEGNKGWKKELNLITWNGREAKFDIRDWSEDHTKMGKGVTLSPAEMKILAETLTKLSTSDI